MIEEADIVERLEPARSSTSPTTTVGVFDGDRLVAYGEVGPASGCDAAVHPDHRGRGIGTAHRALDAGDRPAHAAAAEIGMPVPGGVAPATVC